VGLFDDTELFTSGKLHVRKFDIPDAELTLWEHFYSGKKRTGFTQNDPPNATADKSHLPDLLNECNRLRYIIRLQGISECYALGALIA
jgi:hypothetical protein